MEKCSICLKKPATVICSCEGVLLCNQHIPKHLNEASGIHIPYPVDIYQHKQEIVDSFIDTNRQVFEGCMNFLNYERKCLEDIQKYKSDLRPKINSLKDAIWLQLDNLWESKFQEAVDHENTIQENIQQFKHKGEETRRSCSLYFDLESNLDSIVDNFVTQIGSQYSIQYKCFDNNPAVEWVWSNSLKGRKIEISENGKTINVKNNVDSVAMVDVPMSEGKYFWKIKLDNIRDKSGLRIGVAERNLDLNSEVDKKGFWGIAPGLANKIVKGCSKTAWGKKGTSGDVVEVELEFVNSKGTLSFSINGESLGVLCSDLDPPLYPVAQIRYKDKHQLSLVA